ncbi:MAG: hypothetical protein II000_00935 [Clostridia bacterium]|nr:hypothetical protein [Clostridia bacterium]
MNMTIDELLETPYWIIDILPKQVSKDSPGQYFAVEEYYLSKKQIAELKNRHIGLVLKLNCYRNLSLDEETEINPPPGRIAEEMRKRHLCILSGDSMILSEPDDLSLTLYHPDEELLELVRTLAAGEGLYVWQPPA